MRIDRKTIHTLSKPSSVQKRTIWLSALFIIPLMVDLVHAEAPESQKSKDIEITSSASSKKSKTVDPRWQAKMQEANTTLLEIIQDLSNDKSFHARSNFKRIERNFGKMASLAHGINASSMTAPDSDPTLKIIGDLFQTETKRAFSTLKMGNRQYARSIMKGVTSYCVSCHTRTDSGPAFSLTTPASYLKGLNGLEKSKFLIATRQYDTALNTIEHYLTDPKNASYLKPFQMDLAVHYALVIAVRIKKDPELALKFTQIIADSPSSPYFLKRDATQWIKSIALWKKESTKDLGDDTEDLYEEAVRLLNEARKMQKYPADRSGDVYYLRATSVVHELLKTAKDKKHLSKAFLLAGTSYEVLGSLDFDGLHEIYYESCIRHEPHSETAEACYHRYEHSAFLGYTGSSGTHFPDDVKKKLSTLKKLAEKSTSKEKIL